DRVRQLFGPFPEETPTLETENTPPEPVQMHGDDRDLQPLNNPLKPSFEGQQITGTANGPLGKNADRMALLQGLTRLYEGCWRLRRTGNRDRLHQAKQPAQGFALINWAIDKETDEARHTGPYEEGVDVGDMIADKQCWPLRRDMFSTHHADAIQGMRQHPTDQAHDKGR